jgi:hypothetical protein
MLHNNGMPRTTTSRLRNLLLRRMSQAQLDHAQRLINCCPFRIVGGRQVKTQRGLEDLANTMPSSDHALYAVLATEAPIHDRMVPRLASLLRRLYEMNKSPSVLRDCERFESLMATTPLSKE